MNSEPKKTNESPSSNFEEEVPKGKVPAGEKAVKQPEDENYEAEEPEFDDMVQRKTNDEQPVQPINKPPAKG
ncbi:ABC-type uncharacterized transport system involved in gliding motility auxiliary subunit [Pedobacter sp. CAN_A7]|uniref:hypothetical protein n=1 Tax=Pedobacter sp. CAN_A7 TaxID=2787722 RepID=UPI0018C936E8